MKKILSTLSQFFKKYQFQIFLVLALRIGYSLWLAIVWFVIDKHIPLSQGVIWETYYNLSRSPTLLGRAFIDVWLRWDAVHYMNIAEFGYKGVGVADTVFFPLYPYLVGFISRLTNTNVTLIGILTSSLFTIFALIYFYKLVILIFNDQNLATLSITLLAFFPTGFFLHAPYTEAIFIFLAIGTMYHIEKKEIVRGGFFALVAGLVRPQGVLLLLPLSVAILEESKNNKKIVSLSHLFSLLIAPMGFIFFSLWRSNYTQTGLIKSVNSYSNIKFQDPFSTLVNVFVSLFTEPSVLRTFEFIFVMIFLFILIWMFLNQNFRKHLGLQMYSLATWILITSKTSVNDFVPRLSNRYLLYMFFTFVGIAYLFSKFSKKKKRFIFLISLITNLIFLTLYVLWVYIG